MLSQLTPTRPELDILVKASREAWEKMTPKEKAKMIRAQKISWVYGQLPEENPLTKDQVEQHLIEMGLIERII